VRRHPTATRIRLTVAAENGKGISFYEKQRVTVIREGMEDNVKYLQMERAIGWVRYVMALSGPSRQCRRLTAPVRELLRRISGARRHADQSFHRASPATARCR
jgi:hypothetical protein